MNNRTHNYIHSTEMDTLTENYNAILNLPCVRSILKKNKKLRKENKSLRNLIQSLPEFRNQNCSCNQQPKQKNRKKSVKYVDIKIEPDAISLDSTTINDSDIEIIETQPNLPNIVYDIEEDIDIIQDNTKTLIYNEPTICTKDCASNPPGYTEKDNSDNDSEGEFTCLVCNYVAPHNWCYVCSREDICEYCEGEGCDYGPNEDWVCKACFKGQQQDQHPEDEYKNAFECDDCNFEGNDCYEQLGLTKEESNIYMDLGEPDRCEDCFEKWKNTSNATDYLKQTKEEVEETEEEVEETEEEVEETEEEDVEESGEEEEEEVEESGEEEEEEVEESGEEEEVEESGEEEEVEESGEEEEEEVEESGEEEEVEESGEEEEEEVEESGEEEEEEVEESGEEEEEEVEESGEEEEEEVEESGEDEEVEESGEDEEVEEVEESGEDEEVEESGEDEEEEEVFEMAIKGTSYYVTNETNGIIYTIVDNEDIGNEIGKFVNGKPVFNKN